MFGQVAADEANKFMASIAPDVISPSSVLAVEAAQETILQFNKRRLNVHVA